MRTAKGLVRSPSSPPLLSQVATGDPDAVRQCLDLHGPLVWSMARRWLRDDAAAEDVVQEVFVEVWRTAHRFDPSAGSERGWIATVARRRLIDHRRRVGARPGFEPLEIDTKDESASSERAAMASERAAATTQALDGLEEEQRRLLVLSLKEGLSHAEIANHTGLPLGTVKSRLRTGLDRLRHALRKEVTP